MHRIIYQVVTTEADGAHHLSSRFKTELEAKAWAAKLCLRDKAIDHFELTVPAGWRERKQPHIHGNA